MLDLCVHVHARTHYLYEFYYDVFEYVCLCDTGAYPHIAQVYRTSLLHKSIAQVYLCDNCEQAIEDIFFDPFFYRTLPLFDNIE